MSYLDRIHECNDYNLSHFRPWYGSGQILGWFNHRFAEELRRWPEVFDVQEALVKFDSGESFTGDNDLNVQRRSEVLRTINETLVRDDVIKQTHGELYPVKQRFEDLPFAVIDRASASHYGIKAWGQHLNGYVKRNNEIHMWIAKRSVKKRTFPGMLDNMVAGGLPFDISLRKNIVKECQEEASLNEDMLYQLTSAGAISYCVETPEGLKPDILFCYDLELPESFQPVCQDGEVEEFFLLPLAEVAEIVRETNQFKPNCDLTIIDFLIRHGFIEPFEKGYHDIVCGLRASLKFDEWKN